MDNTDDCDTKNGQHSRLRYKEWTTLTTTIHKWATLTTLVQGFSTYSRFSMCTSSINSTPGTSSATPWSIYLLTTLLISLRSFSVTYTGHGLRVTDYVYASCAEYTIRAGMCINGAYNLRRIASCVCALSATVGIVRHCYILANVCYRIQTDSLAP